MRIDKNVKAFTIVELMISILISVVLLGWVFYFLSDTILGISRTSAQSKFLKDFYSFTTILDTWDFQVIHDYESGEWFDVGMLTSIDGNSGVLIGVVDANTQMLSATGNIDIYHQTVLWYRSLSSVEIADIIADGNVAYDYTFLKDKLFPNFSLYDFQLQMFNSGTTTDMYLHIFPNYRPTLEWESWESLPKHELFEYSLTF